MSRRGGNNRTSPISIALPVIIAIIVLVLIIKGLSSSLGKTSTESKEAGQSYALITPKADAKVGIFMASSDSPTDIQGPSKLFTTDKMVRVASGEGEITLENSTSKLAIESLTEIAYAGKKDGKESFTLMNGYSWIESPNGDLNVSLKYFTVKLSAGTILITHQNTLASNVYILQGEADVYGEAGTVNLKANQMITLLKSQAKSSNLAEMVQPLDDNIKLSNSYIKYGGDGILAKSTAVPNNTTGSGILGGSGTIAGSGTNLEPITISYPEDEMTVDSSTVSIEGKINSASVKKIVFDKRDAQILSVDGSFLLKDYALTEATNDIIYRVYDESGTQIKKGTLTIHVSGKKPTVKKPDVITFPVSSKDFKIISPIGNPYRTTERSVKIKGSFAPNLVKYIKVNSYQGQLFRQFGTTWSYSASIDNGNMEEGMNEYLVTYFGPNDEVLATTKLYIVKEQTPTETETTTPVTPSTLVAPPTTSGSVTPKNTSESKPNTNSDTTNPTL